MQHAASDVVVIGGGPAGASVARELSSLGHRVFILTRSAVRPHLAETIPPSSEKLLLRLDWQRYMDSARFLRTTGNTVYWSGASQPREAAYAGGSLGYQVDRGRLNSLLLETLQRSSCTVVHDATVLAVEDGVVRFARGGATEEIYAPWVLDCSGRSGVIARSGWRRPLPELRTLALVGAWEHPQAWPAVSAAAASHTIVESYAAGWAWSVPLSPTQRHITVMVDPRIADIRAHGAVERAYREELARVPQLRRLTSDAQMLAPAFAREASPYAAHQVAAAGRLLVGDAATFLDPLSSYGIKKALASAWLASVVVHTCLSDSAMTSAALDLYESRERAMYVALERQRAELAKAALAAGESSDFWSARLDASVNGEPNEEPDTEALRNDPAIQAAFQELKRRQSISLEIAPRVRRPLSPAVRENRVRLEERLQLDGSSLSVRFIRNIDLVALTEMAPSFSQVPELYERYCRQIAPAALPDFLGALAFLVGRGFLQFA